MTIAALALAWTGISMISGLFLGTLLHRYGGEVAPAGDPLSTLDGAAIAAPESRVSSRDRHTTR